VDINPARVTAEIIAGWFGVNRNGHSNSPHVHPEASISGVYYVTAPSGATDPNVGSGSGSGGGSGGGSGRINGRHSGRSGGGGGGGRVPQGCGGKLRLIDPRPGAGFRREERAIQPAVGKLVLFPGFLEHRVEPLQTLHKGSVPRIAVAFNVRIRERPAAELSVAGLEMLVPSRHVQAAATPSSDESQL
jgi:hypothetical protein